MNYFSAVSTGHSNLISNSYRFQWEKYTVILICFSQHTHFQMSAVFVFCFYFQVSSVEIGLGLYLNIYVAGFTLDECFVRRLKSLCSG